MERLTTWLSEAPARLAGLSAAKGAIAPGRDADLVIWDPDDAWTVDAAGLYHRHPVTPYDGARLRGQVKTTILRGEVVFDDGACVGLPRGRLL
jgi:allantoinase